MLKKIFKKIVYKLHRWDYQLYQAKQNLDGTDTKANNVTDQLKLLSVANQNIIFDELYNDYIDSSSRKSNMIAVAVSSCHLLASSISEHHEVRNILEDSHEILAEIEYEVLEDYDNVGNIEEEKKATEDLIKSSQKLLDSNSESITKSVKSLCLALKKYPEITDKIKNITYIGKATLGKKDIPLEQLFIENANILPHASKNNLFTTLKIEL